MAKVSYANLKLKPSTEISTFTFGNQTIEVLNYLPIEDKYDFVTITLQKAEQEGIYNPVLLDLFFHLHLVYMYTNLSFTDKQKENELKIYDTLLSNGFFDEFYKVFNENEYEELQKYIEELMEMTLNYKNSTASLLKSFIEDFPKNAQIASDIVDSFDKTKYKEVVDFATAANGGRNILTNQ